MVTVAVVTVMVVAATLVVSTPARFHLEFHVQVILRQHTSLAGPPGTPARFGLAVDVAIAMAAMAVVSTPTRFHLELHVQISLRQHSSLAGLPWGRGERFLECA